MVIISFNLKISKIPSYFQNINLNILEIGIDISVAAKTEKKAIANTKYKYECVPDGSNVNKHKFEIVDGNQDESQN